MAATLPVFHAHSEVSATPPSAVVYDEEYALSKKMGTVIMVIHSLIFVLGVIGNGLVIFITGFRMKKTVNTVWFLNLAIADFTFTFFLLLGIIHIALEFNWPFGLVICKFSSTLVILNLYASVYLLTVISVDRCISVRHPVWAKNHRTPRLASFVALGVWILALVFSSPNIYFWKTIKHPTDENVILCQTQYGNTTEEANHRHRAVVISQFTFGFVIPFGVIIACYGAIVLRLWRNRLTQSSKPFKVITAVIVAFFSCWFPFHVVSLLEIETREQEELHLLLVIGLPLTLSLAFINSCLNPILYVFMGHDFKKSLRRSLFSAFEDAFAEESSRSTANIKAKSSNELESQDI